MAWRSLRLGGERANVLARVPGPSSARRRGAVAAFDLDDTLVETWSGAPPWRRRSGADWTWRYASVPQRLREEARAGRALVVFSNQSHVRSAHHGKAAAKLKKVVDAVARELDLTPEQGGLAFVAATQKDAYRKSIQGELWAVYEELFGISVDIRNSFYVGDAAGRESDFGSGDADFARARGVRFMTPEEYFMDAAPDGSSSP
ncbi:Polynucleotide kinase-3'-phosphatase, putative [Hondaea fermentalgiana]|uniref:Polynucleotide kinase-3'-phosphatase, putative n=1 Tax=Hondaea fermentalgiana TaxID=2315210 RepID=A0A2R5G0C4_9STRA|nr:Polynucleotide kinase-3'-phosphatase, putative [Hondaea fermentalgiana]|eukprot:GBG23975.1 Polynucleotide kinase-3'-phosphatase, putative [Hondaea fermentalgiana]